MLASSISASLQVPTPCTIVSSVERNTCASLPITDTATTPRTCSSSQPTSATLTLWRAAIRSFICATTRRLSFSERAPGTRNWSRSTPTQIDSSGAPYCLMQSRRTGSAASARRGDFLDQERLDLIADLHVVEVLEADAALVALLDLAHVVLEATERAELAGPDDRAVAQEPRLRIPDDLPVDDHATGDVADLRNLEDLADLDPADDLFLVRRTEEPDHRLPDVVEDLVDHLVVPDLDAELFCGLPRLDVRAHVVAHDDRVRGVGQRDVALRHGADARVDDLQARALDLDRLERLAKRFERAVDVGLDHELELDEPFLGLLRVEILERPALAALERRALDLLEPVLDERLRVALRLHDHEVVARGGD